MAFNLARLVRRRYHPPASDDASLEAVKEWTMNFCRTAENRALQIIRKRRHLFDRLRKKLYQCKRLEGDQLEPFRAGTMKGWDRDLIPPPPMVH